MSLESLLGALEGVSRGTGAAFATKLPASDEDKGIVAHFLGIPVGFQFGTAAGLTGIPALLVDVLTDPVNLLLPFAGALTKGGRAAKGIGTILKGAKAVEESASVTEKLVPLIQRSLESGPKNLSAIQAELRPVFDAAVKLESSGFRNVLQSVTGMDAPLARETLRGLRKAGAVKGEILPSTAEIDRMLSALDRGGVEGLTTHIQGSISARDGMRSLLSDALNAGDYATMKGKLKDLKGIAPNDQWAQLFSGRMRSAWKDAFAAAKAGEPIGALATGARAQAEAGQRALVQFKVPFGPEGTLVKGAPVLGAIAESVQKAKAALLGAKTAGQAAEAASALRTAVAAPIEPLIASPSGLNRIIVDAGDSVTRSAEAAKKFATEGAQGDVLLEQRAVMADRHRRLAQYNASRVGTAFDATMQGMGLTDAADRGRVMELLQAPDKHLTRGGLKSKRASFGETHIFGDLKPASVTAGFTDRHVMVADSMSAAFRAVGSTAVKEGLVENLIPDYMGRITEIVAGREADYAKFVKRPFTTATSTFWRHALERSVPAWDELMELEAKGVVKVEKDPGKVAAAYMQSLAQAGANKSFVQGVQTSKIPFTLARGEKIASRNLMLHLILPGEKASFATRTGQYVKVGEESPSVMYLARQIGEEAGRKGFGFARHVWVHKSIADTIRAAIEPAFAASPGRLPVTATGSEKWLSGALLANSVAKRGLLFPGTFHFVSLTEHLLQTLGWDGFRTAMPKLIKGLRQNPGVKSYLEILPDAEEAIRAGLSLEAPLDAEVDTFQKALTLASKNLPVTKPVIDAVKTMESWASKKLWGQYHSPMKLYAYNELLSRALVTHPGTPVEIAKQEIAQHVNKVFGGGNLERLVGSKKGQQILRLFFLAPDWLIGNTQVAADVFANTFLPKQGFQNFARSGLGGALGRHVITPEMVLGADVRSFYARQYALRTGLMMAFTAQFVNAAFTGHFMFQNEDPTRIQLPGTDDKGKPMYVAIFDPFMMPFDMVASPAKFIGRKASPVFRAASTVVVGHDFTGAPIVGTKDGPFQAIANWLGFAAKSFLPIGLQQSSSLPLPAQALSLLGLPVRRSPPSAPQTNETVPAEHPTKTKQQLRAEVTSEVQQQIEKAVSQYAEMHAAMMKSDQYRRGLDSARYAVVPPFALLPQ